MPLSDNTFPERESANPKQERLAAAIYSEISSHTETLAARSMALHFLRAPDIAAAYTERQRAFYLEDAGYNIESLASAILFETPEVFSDYVIWLLALLRARNIPTGGLPLHFECLRDALHERLTREQTEMVDRYLDAGLQALAQHL